MIFFNELNYVAPVEEEEDESDPPREPERGN